MKVKPVAGRLNHSCYGELELSSWSNQLRHVGHSGSHTEESDVETRGRKRGREKEGGRRERASGSKRVQKRKTVREEKREVVKKIIKQDEIRNISSNKEYTNSEGGGGGLDLNVLHNQFCLIYFFPSFI